MNNKIMIIMSGIICNGFIGCGLLDILDYLIIKIILGGLFAFFVVQLFYVNLRLLKKEKQAEN